MRVKTTAEIVTPTHHWPAGVQVEVGDELAQTWIAAGMARPVRPPRETATDKQAEERERRA